jgi:O-antigen ligase
MFDYLVRRILFLVFVANLVWNVERLLFVNEWFAFFGLVLLIRGLRMYSSFGNLRNDKVLFYVWILLVYGFVYALISLLFLRDGPIMGFARTLPLVYSIPAFYLGVEFARGRSKEAIPAVQPLNAVYLAPMALFGPRLTGPSAITLMGDSERRPYSLIVFVCVVILCFRNPFDGFLTNIVHVVFIFAFFFAGNTRIVRSLLTHKWLYVLLLGLVFITLYWVFETYGKFVDVGASAFNLTSGGSDSANAMWRIMFWSYVFKVHVLTHPLFGIGFGTRLFELGSRFGTVLGYGTAGRDPLLEYTLGTHNSFIYILVRMGLVGFVLFFLISFHLIKSFMVLPRDRKVEKMPFFFAFVLISFSAIFNVILETPLYGATYWVLTGLLYGELKKVSADVV